MIWTIALCLAGVLLGLNWNVLILIPASAGLLIVFGILAVVDGANTRDVIAGILLPLIALQAGYMLGIVSRGVLGQYIPKRSSAHSEHI